jgi:hypothetical protein
MDNYSPNLVSTSETSIPNPQMPMKTLRTLIALGAIAAMSSPLAAAQELPKPTKYENVTWYMSLYIKFKPSRAEEAQQIINQYFIPADKAIGREVIGFECKSGRWDVIAFIPMLDGPGDLAWKGLPTEGKWAAEIAKIAGGPQKAIEVLAKFSELIADEDRQIVLRQK